jgi:hypothetical protein
MKEATDKHLFYQDLSHLEKEQLINFLEYQKKRLMTDLNDILDCIRSIPQEPDDELKLTAGRRKSKRRKSKRRKSKRRNNSYLLNI